MISRKDLLIILMAAAWTAFTINQWILNFR